MNWRGWEYVHKNKQESILPFLQISPAAGGQISGEGFDKIGRFFIRGSFKPEDHEKVMLVK